MRITTVAFVAMLSAVSGCASIVNESTQPLRIETYDDQGKDVASAQCELQNENGKVTVTTPGIATVKRSASDLGIACLHATGGEAHGVAVSRANGGMFGNILFGGVVGAVIDHSKGTAYSYPQWIRLVFGKSLSFDRNKDEDGKPNLGAQPAPSTAQK